MEDGFNQLNAILDAIKKDTRDRLTERGGGGSVSKGTSESLASKESSTKLKQPPTEMQKMIESFWRGDVCLHGGTGWWKYEVCYGKTVSIFKLSLK